MRENPFLFESEESENGSQYEDSSEFFENEYEVDEYEGEGEYDEKEYENEYDESEYDETEYDEAEYDETEYDEMESGDEYEDEVRGVRNYRAPVRTARSLSRYRPYSARRLRPLGRPPFRPRPQFRARPQMRQWRAPSPSWRPRRQWRPRYPRYPYPYPYPYYSTRPLIATQSEPAAPQSSEMVRLLQTLLNKTLGLNLPVDGVMSVETRSAIRSFQDQPSAPPPTGGDAEPAPAPGGGAPPPEAPASAEEFEFEFSYPGSNYGEFEDEYYEGETFEGETAKTASALRYVRGFASPDADCADAFRRAKKTRAQALTIINTQIGRAIRMLRFAAGKLKRGSRTAPTRALFRKIFRVTPEFVPTWMQPTASIKDRGDVVATRCARVADMLESGGLRYFCTMSAKNCPDCGDPSPKNNPFACSSWGKHRVVCLHTPFWDAMGRGDMANVLAVLMHEPFHVYFGKYVTEHSRTVGGKPVSVGKFGGIYCILQFVFEINKTSYPSRIKRACDHTQVRI